VQVCILIYYAVQLFLLVVALVVCHHNIWLQRCELPNARV